MRNQPHQIPINYSSNNAGKGRGMLTLAVMMLISTSHAFVVTVVPSVLPHQKQTQQSHCLLYAAVGIFFGTSVRLEKLLFTF